MFRANTGLFIVGLALPALLCAQDWPQLLGPDHTGSVNAAQLVAQFPNNKPPVLWQANVGFGSAPVAVKSGHVFAFGLFKSGTDTEATKAPNSAPTLDEIVKGTFNPADLSGTPEQAKKSDFPMSFRGDVYAFCLDAATGARVWAVKLSDEGIAFKTTKHSSTAWEVAAPLADENAVYIHTHTGRLYCVNAADGKLKWQANLFDHHMSTWLGGQQGNSCAPLRAGTNICVCYEGLPTDAAKKEVHRLTVTAFDAETGQERWSIHAPFPALNVRTARLGFANLGTQATVLCSCGGGTMGLDADTGKMRWSFDLAAANPDTLKSVPLKFAADEKMAKDYKVDALREPFPGYAPLAWENYVIDAACVGHNSITSATWCLKIGGDHATRVWQTSDFVPQSASLKSNMVVRDGKLYGFDSYFPGFIREYAVTRPYRGAAIGQFQCRDIETGKLLWSSDALHPQPPGPTRVDSTNCLFVLAGNTLILDNADGLWIAQLLNDGVKVMAHVAQAPKAGRALSEPAFADGRIYVRQLDADPKSGLAPVLGSGGNLTCIDLKAK